MANSVDPDQTLRFAASDLGLHCLLTGLSVPIFKVITVRSTGISNGIDFVCLTCIDCSFPKQIKKLPSLP